MNIYQIYRQAHNMNNTIALPSNNELDNYILARWEQDKRRIILDPAAYEASINAAAADITRKVLDIFKK